MSLLLNFGIGRSQEKSDYSAATPSTSRAAASTAATPPATLDGAASAIDSIQPGTTITMQNWQQYKQYMPGGMVDLFEGKYFWKMPADVEMEVGPTVIHPLPTGYLEATEKFSPQVKLLTFPDGGLTIANYTAGEPFPNPQEPHKGWKILADLWFRYEPHLVVNTPNNLGFFCTQDSYGSIDCQKSLWVYRRLSYNTDPGIPMTTPGGEGTFYTEWSMIEEPEQMRYTATLTISYTDLSKPQALYIFKPALRRSEALSAAARCAATGADLTPDDSRFGFNGNIQEFDAALRGEKRILSEMDIGTNGANFPDVFDMPLGWPKPSWGKWEVRDVAVLDVRKIPSNAAGYCYGKRIIYVDKQFYGALWEDLFDAKMNLWKIALIQPIILKVPGLGPQNSTGAGVMHYWDIQNNHATYGGPNDGHGYDVLINSDVPKEWDDVRRYSTPGGLNEIMR